MSLDVTKLVGVKRHGDRLTSQCPVCAGMGRDGSRCHLVLYNNGRFGCIADSSPEHSKQIYALVSGGVVDTFVAPRIEIERTWPANLLDRLVKDYSYWKTRGIDEQVVAPFRGGVATDGQMKDRWVFPIFNRADEIVGFSGRDLTGKAKVKWKHLGKSSSFVWGGLDDIDSCRRIVLVESIGDSLALRQHGVPESICLFGVNLSQAVLAHVIATGPEQIIVSTNNDVAHEVGQRAAQRVRNVLDSFFNSDRIEVRLPPVKDWGVATAQQIKETFDA